MKRKKQLWPWDIAAQRELARERQRAKSKGLLPSTTETSKQRRARLEARNALILKLAVYPNPPKRKKSNSVASKRKTLKVASGSTLTPNYRNMESTNPFGHAVFE